MKYLLFLLFFNFVFLGISKQTEYVDFKTAKAKISFGDLTKKEVRGTITYEFKILKDVDSIFIDANNFQEIEYILNGNITGKYYNGKQLIIKHPFKANSTHSVDIVWKTSPKKAMYFIDWDLVDSKHSRSVDSISTMLNAQNKQIWTQGQGKYTSNWLPSIDDMNDKIEFDLSITFDKEYEVIANGKLTDKQTNDSTTTWYYDMQKPMSSYLVALAIGEYDKKVEYSKSGIPLEMYYYPEDSLKIEPTYRYTKQIFDFLEEEIGVLYPWQNYKQVPVKDFLYAGMENTSATIFADSFVTDSIGFVDKNYVNVNAHELAHQWFGDLVTETSGPHHWLQEGFATYYALLAERDIFGDDYYYWQLYEYAQELLAQDEADGSTSLLDPKSSSTTFYKKGAWVLHMLREQVGDESFRKAVENYLKKHQFKNVETDYFIKEVENISGEDLNEFVKVWLDEEKLPIENMYKSLEKNDNTSFLVTIQDTPFLSYRTDDNDEYIPSSLVLQLPNAYYPVKKAILEELIKKSNYPTYKDLLKEAFESNNLKVRQTVAQLLQEIPLELKEDYESLLNDKSYITVETALFNLWSNFPKDQKKYLNKTKAIQGFNDKNVRILWLTLALITEDFEVENKKQYFDELTDYTSPKYGFEVRQNAFQYLNQIQACNAICKESLNQATKHHNWRFSKFAKTMLEVLEK